MLLFFNWGICNLILFVGFGGMRFNIVVVGFYNMDDFWCFGYLVWVFDVLCMLIIIMRELLIRKY